jgi:hypothetical protein
LSLKNSTFLTTPFPTLSSLYSQLCLGGYRIFKFTPGGLYMLTPLLAYIQTLGVLEKKIWKKFQNGFSEYSV